MTDRVKLPPLNPMTLRLLRYANTCAQTKYSSGGVPKRRLAPKPITLRRADYEARKASEGGDAE